MEVWVRILDSWLLELCERSNDQNPTIWDMISPHIAFRPCSAIRYSIVAFPGDLKMPVPQSSKLGYPEDMIVLNPLFDRIEDDT
jgi:hypothetical protein